MPYERQDLLDFGAYRIDVAQRILLSGNNPIPLAPKVFDTLLALVESPGRILEKEELLKRVWPDTFVEEGSLARNISTLRKVLGEGHEDQQFIETIPKRGYRFVASVRRISAETAAPVGPDGHAVSGFSDSKDHNSAPISQRNAGASSAHRRILLISGIGMMLIIGIVAGRWYFSTRGHPDQTIDSLVVLPFLDLSDDHNSEYFSDGLTEALINALSNVPRLRVVARTTAFQFKGRADDVREIGRRLRVGVVLEESVRRQGDRLRVTVQMHRVDDGYHYWSRSWDRDLKDVFGVQEEIARQVANSLWPNGETALPVVRPLTSNLEAYNLYLQGEFHSRRVAASLGTSLNRAMVFFREAIEKDPNFAEAYVGLAICYNRAANTGQLRPADAYPHSKAALQKALGLNPTLPSAYATKGWISYHYDWNWVTAEEELRRAIATKPTSTEPHHAYSHFLAGMGRFAESLEESRRAIEVDPLDTAMRAHLAWHYNMARNPEQAMQAAEAALEIDPVHPDALVYLRWAYESTGRFDKAIDAQARLGQPSQLIQALRDGLAIAGPHGYWGAVRDGELQRSRNGYIGVTTIASAYAHLGQSREAIEWLERGFRERQGGLVNLKVLPDFDRLRGEPGFQELVKRVGLP